MQRIRFRGATARKPPVHGTPRSRRPRTTTGQAAVVRGSPRSRTHRVLATAYRATRASLRRTSAASASRRSRAAQGRGRRRGPDAGGAARRGGGRRGGAVSGDERSVDVEELLATALPTKTLEHSGCESNRASISRKSAQVFYSTAMQRAALSYSWTEGAEWPGSFPGPMARAATRRLRRSSGDACATRSMSDVDARRAADPWCERRPHLARRTPIYIAISHRACRGDLACDAPARRVDARPGGARERSPRRVRGAGIGA